MNKKVVYSLGKVEELIWNEQKQIGQYDVLIKPRFVQMFGDININSKSWETKFLGELCTIV